MRHVALLVVPLCLAACTLPPPHPSSAADEDPSTGSRLGDGGSSNMSRNGQPGMNQVNIGGGSPGYGR